MSGEKQMFRLADAMGMDLAIVGRSINGDLYMRPPFAPGITIPFRVVASVIQPKALALVINGLGVLGIYADMVPQEGGGHGCDIVVAPFDRSAFTKPDIFGEAKVDEVSDAFDMILPHMVGAYLLRSGATAWVKADPTELG